MRTSFRVGSVVPMVALVACFGGGDDDNSGGASAGSGGTSGHTITGGADGTSGIAAAGASGGGSGGASSGVGGGMGGANCPENAPRATTTALPCSASDVPYGTSCGYLDEASECSERFECECTSESPGESCFWHSLGQACPNAGSGGSGGGGGSSGAGGAGGSGGGANPCPDTPPTDGTPCTAAEAAYCTYQDCGGAGEINARCQAPTVSMWLVETKPCGTTDCHGMTCGVGQVCMEVRGGELSGFCLDNPCGASPQSCDCNGTKLCSAGSCTDFSGNLLICNTCPSGLCP